MTQSLLVFARAPERGRVKTRLAATLGDDAALAIHKQLTERVVRDTARSRAWATTLVSTPDDELDVIREWLGNDLRVEGQGAGDLGSRMRRAIERRVSEGAGAVVVIGSDCPDVDERIVSEAFHALHDCDVVIGPAADGGYYLIGVRRPLPLLFDGVPWSTDAVLRVTMECAASAGVSVQLLDERRDIDTAEDWWAWQAHEQARAGTAPTRR